MKQIYCLLRFAQIERAYVQEITGEQASANIMARYALLHPDTLAQLWTQGQYYAWHDNG